MAVETLLAQIAREMADAKETQSSEMTMPIQQERRDSERVSCRLSCPYELTKPVDSNTVKLAEGHGHAINRSSRGMLLLLPEKVNKQQVVEIQAPAEAKKKKNIKLVEVCWTRRIPVENRVNMYLVGVRFLFEIPAPGQPPKTH